MKRRTLLASVTLAIAGGCVPRAWATSAMAGFEIELTAYLARHVHWNPAGTATAVDYAGVRRERATLRALQDQTSRVDMDTFASWPLAARQAFLVNAYNVWTLALIADAPPDTESIKDLGSLLRSPWKRAFIPFLGETRSLDDIEHGLLRGAPDFDEPRIHFAVNCASIGCPALRPEAYVAGQWDSQLEDQTRRFLRDGSRNRVLHRDPLRVGISRIFDWYGKDFAMHGGVPGFLAGYAGELGLDATEADRLRRGDADVDFLDYDWALNDRTLA